MDTRAHILIVDDDREIRTLLAEQLETYGFAVLGAEDGRAMRRVLDRETVDLVVLDLNLPREDGLALCRDLRAKSSLPVIMLTARGEPIDRILGLELGADDYMAKPFEPRELVARIRNILKRRDGLAIDEAEGWTAQRLRFADRILDLQRRHLIGERGQVIMLSGAEFRFLKAFAEHPNRVFSREQLARIGAGREIDGTDRAVDLQISRLRAKLGDDARAPSLIKTVRSEGYVLAVPVERDP
ncbi:response regulator [Phenylobacterium sp.]|uniref:response regulator n=1 Tax=Phenylobacterium sp. TaxID=1871053 RepID=UPI00120E2C7F|nr:response regulator [Phenylobacterium sp.]THD59286.1 MAG: response regulator [Phenylobacterium sp.]